jgi:hypothetical protein
MRCNVYRTELLDASMSVNLHQRLKRLEARVQTADEPEELVIEFAGPEREVVRTLVIRPGAPASQVSARASR